MTKQQRQRSCPQWVVFVEDSATHKQDNGKKPYRYWEFHFASEYAMQTFCSHRFLSSVRCTLCWQHEDNQSICQQNSNGGKARHQQLATIESMLSSWRNSFWMLSCHHEKIWRRPQKRLVTHRMWPHHLSREGDRWCRAISTLHSKSTPSSWVVCRRGNLFCHPHGL